MTAATGPSNLISLTFQKASEAFALELANQLTTALQATSNVRPLGISSGSGAELLQALGGPFCQIPLQVVMPPGAGALVLVDSLAGFLLQVLLGAPAAVPDMPVPCQWTELERDLLTGLLERLTKQCAAVWTAADATEFYPEGDIVCGNLADQEWYTEACVGVQYEVEINGMFGTAELVLPLQVAAARTEPDKASNRAHANPHGAAQILDLIGAGEVLVTVELAGPSIPATEFAHLEVGQVLSLDHPVQQPLALNVNGQPAFSGLLGPSARGRRMLHSLSTPIQPRP